MLYNQGPSEEQSRFTNTLQSREFSPSAREIISMEASRRDKLVKSIEQDHYNEFRGHQTSLSPPDQHNNYESYK